MTVQMPDATVSFFGFSQLAMVVWINPTNSGDDLLFR